MLVIIAEDELGTRKMLRFVLEQQAGHRVLEAETAAETLRILRQERCDLLLADLTLPDLDGLELVRQIRRTSNIPIMIISARVNIPDRVRGLRSGADDYIAKPFDVSELLARVDALLWRASRKPRVEPAGRLEVGGLVLDPELQTVEVRGSAKVRLTPTEFRLLLNLARTPGEVRPRHDLERIVAGDADGGEGALNTYIYNLRNKLAGVSEKSELIETVRAHGYRLAV
jgi:DNA-binding response OmpR family regulator